VGDARRLQSFRRRLGFVRHFLAFLQALVPFHLDGREVDEHVLSAVIVGDEAETLLIIEPLNLPVAMATPSSIGRRIDRKTLQPAGRRLPPRSLRLRVTDTCSFAPTVATCINPPADPVTRPAVEGNDSGFRLSVKGANLCSAAGTGKFQGMECEHLLIFTWPAPAPIIVIPTCLESKGPT